MEIKGKIIALLPIKEGTSKSTGNAWKSQDYVLETQDLYPKHVCFNVWGDKIDAFAIKVGDVLTVSIDIDAHEYEGKWFNQIRAWKVEKDSDNTTPVEPSITPVEPSQEPKKDDIPF